MIRPFSLFSAVLVTCALAGTACQSESNTPDAEITATAVRTSPDSAALDQVKAGSFVIGFRGGFPALAEGRDDAAIAAIFTETCADIRSGTTENEAVSAVSDRLGEGGTQVGPQEAQAVYQMIAVMCQGQ
ncbi:hypothetical protein [Nocardia sp. NPDC024068]|uniref:hypothetical protein n=1 Tax=Nocardia sp. NPDC024068 TaxID=3157197 RepID=UPI0033E2EBFA